MLARLVLSMVCAARQETSEVLAKALTAATLLSIPLEFMDHWMSKYKSWYQFVVTSYRNRFEEMLKTIMLSLFQIWISVWKIILKKGCPFGQSLKMTHQEITTDLNSSREVISRLLKKLKAKGG